MTTSQRGKPKPVDPLDELEQLNFELYKKVNALEAQLTDKTSEISKLNRQIESFVVAEAKYNYSIESTIAKAKETYRKYDAYLENAEDAVNYAWFFALGTLDLMDHIFENLIRESPTDLNGFFRKEIDEEAESQRKASIEKLSKSEFLKKKKLFLEISKLAQLKDELDLKEKQAKFDRLQTLIGQGTQPRPVNVVRPFPNQEPVSHNSENNQEAQNAGKSGARGNESFVQNTLSMLTQNIISTKNMIDQNPNINVDPDVLRELIGRTNEFIASIQNYFFNLKNTGSFIDDELEIPKEGMDQNLLSMENLERALAKIGALEKVGLEKLMEVKSRNDRLRGVQQHLQRLTNQFGSRNRPVGKGPL